MARDKLEGIIEFILPAGMCKHIVSIDADPFRLYGGCYDPRTDTYPYREGEAVWLRRRPSSLAEVDILGPMAYKNFG